jgi:hypothetical protein
MVSREKQEILKIIQEEFESYGLALDKLLKAKGLKSWQLRDKLYEEGKKPTEKSLDEMISSWRNNKKPVGLKYQLKINELFDYEINEYSNGSWQITQKSPEPRTDLTDLKNNSFDNFESEIKKYLTPDQRNRARDFWRYSIDLIKEIEQGALPEEVKLELIGVLIRFVEERLAEVEKNRND